MLLRSREWFAGREELAFQHRSALRSMGLDPDFYDNKPVIGIANSWSDLNNCNQNLRQLAEAVKRGVLAAGGLPLEFPTISLGEEFMKPSAMLYRNLMAMDVEETLRSNPIDGVVLLCNCDKTTPAQLMGAASANLPAIQLNGGARSVGHWRARSVNRVQCRGLQHHGDGFDDDFVVRGVGDDAARRVQSSRDRRPATDGRRSHRPANRRDGP